MSAAFTDEMLVEAVRASSPGVRSQILSELLEECARRDGPWPLSVTGPNHDLIALLLPRPGRRRRSPPELSPEREAELAERMTHLDDAVDLQDYIDSLDSRGGQS
jgi:hypothetical protein